MRLVRDKNGLEREIPERPTRADLGGLPLHVVVEVLLARIEQLERRVDPLAGCDDWVCTRCRGVYDREAVAQRPGAPDTIPVCPTCNPPLDVTDGGASPDDHGHLIPIAVENARRARAAMPQIRVLEDKLLSHGRHDDSCAGDAACTCGLGPLTVAAVRRRADQVVKAMDPPAGVTVSQEFFDNDPDRVYRSFKDMLDAAGKKQP